MCFVAERADTVPGRAQAERMAAASEPPRLRRYRAALIEGRGYSMTLAIEAPSLAAAEREAALYAARHGYCLKRVNAVREGGRPW